MAEDQNSSETLVEETSVETAKETETLEKTSQPEEEMITIPRKKWHASQAESIKLAKKVKELEGEKVEKVASTETVDTETDAKTLDELVEKKVEEKIAPIKKQTEGDKVDGWFKKNPEAMDYLKDIEDNYAVLPGKTIEQKLENALLIAKKDAMKEAGKKEMAFNIYQKEQVFAGGGASVSSGESLPDLSEEEKKVAAAFGIKEETYAKNKLKK